MAPGPRSGSCYNGRVSCAGYYGTFKAGSYAMVATWDNSGDAYECFGIATDRTIWHAWPGSGGWKPMPGNGHADDAYSIYQDSFRRIVMVAIPNAPRPLWCQDYTRSTGWTGKWYECP
ncbi:hypothetical protein [Amycolatopsis sp. NPDC059657]|uniref:hypothetical protein n=1 Tax=Amycolatopsis sp. NPDC059657 TaxID=3346899 RepID=UPI00366F32CF